MTKGGFMDNVMVRVRAMDRFIPVEGYNVVAVDTFETDADCELSLVGHYDTREQAEAAAERHREQYPHDRAHIYGPARQAETPAKPSGS